MKDNPFLKLKNRPTPKHVQDHIRAFGKKPNTIGIFWSDPDQEKENIIKAIEDGIPYDEMDLLTEYQKKLYKEGRLLF